MLSSLLSELGEAFGLSWSGCAKHSVYDALSEYFSDFWNLVDLTRIVFFALALDNVLKQSAVIGTVTNCLQPSLSKPTQTLCAGNKFEQITNLGESFGFLNAILVIVHIVWILKYMKHKRLAVVRETIYTSGDDLSHFMIVFLIIYAGFVFMATLFFGAHIEEYSTLFGSVNACFRILLGDFDYGQLETAFPMGAFIFFWSFILICSFIMFNITIGIVCAAFDVAKGDGEDAGSVFVDASDSMTDFLFWLHDRLQELLDKRAPKRQGHATEAA